MSAQDNANAFLAIAGEFRLGELVTEQQHELTHRLSEYAEKDLREGYRVLKEVDRRALEVLEDQACRIEVLARDIAVTLDDGGRIFMAGCGATGRLALTLEVLCREGLLPGDRVIGFMAGGDAALIRSLEGFEDYPDYGARQLRELGFRDGDLLIGITEGGETPFVIGATEAARDCGSRRPWFCYCNPDEILSQVAMRSRRVLEDRGILCLNLTCGPMALAGSTRMQATTVQMAAVGLALSWYRAPERIAPSIKALREAQETLDYEALEPMTEAEAAYAKGGRGVLYRSEKFGMAVLTDTTERSPTFSLPAFENTHRLEQAACLCYLMIDEPNATLAWKRLLRREPRTLEWPEVEMVAGREYLMGYDISQKARAHRLAKLGHESVEFRISEDSGYLLFQLGELEVKVKAVEEALGCNLLLKMLLNAHSTLIMGRLGRYEGNLMTWVRAGNNKLIDRAIRYVQALARMRGWGDLSYGEVCHVLFEAKQDLAEDGAIVLRTLNLLERGR